MSEMAGRLLTAIEEREQLARGAATGHPEWRGATSDDIGAWTVYDDAWSVASVVTYDHNDALGTGYPPSYRNVAADDTVLHIAVNDPAAVLAMCAAHRTIVARYTEAVREAEKADGWWAELRAETRVGALADVLGDLMQAYGVTP